MELLRTAPVTGSMPVPAEPGPVFVRRVSVMTRRVKVQQITLHQDSRGTVFEALDAGYLARQRNVHVVVTEPACVRGNHYHSHATEVVTVQGPALVRLRDEHGVWDTMIEEGVVTRFVIPPGVAHAIQNLGTQPMLLVAFRDRPHDLADPDVVRDVLIEG
jgi:dTDP-4-dehydrorhamnose 3,5-epimerase-like enzyme